MRVLPHETLLDVRVLVDDPGLERCEVGRGGASGTSAASVSSKARIRPAPSALYVAFTRATEVK